MELDRKRKHNVHRGLHTSGKSNPEPDWLKVKLDVFWCHVNKIWGAQALLIDQKTDDCRLYL